jgi:hypothetical protein
MVLRVFRSSLCTAVSTSPLCSMGLGSFEMALSTLMGKRPVALKPALAAGP